MKSQSIKRITFYIIFIFLFSFLQNQFLYGQKLQVDYYIWESYDSPLRDLSSKLLKAIEQSKIKPFSVYSQKKLSKKELISKLQSVQEYGAISKEEFCIMLAMGDSSMLDEIVFKYDIDKVKELVASGENLANLFEIKQRKPFETYQLYIGLSEKVILDKSAKRQNGIPEYIMLVIPKYCTKEKKQKEVLCKIRYQDFQKLNIIEEQKILQEKSFIINTGSSDIWITEESGIRYKLSEQVKYDKEGIENSIFKYFTEHFKVSLR